MREIWKVVDPRSAALIDAEGDVKAYAPSTHSQAYFDFTSQRRVQWNLWRFTASDKEVEKAREAMAMAMFTKELQVIEVATNKGSAIVSMIQYIPEYHLWLSTAYPSPKSDDLTKRQLEVLRLLAHDLSLKDVATTLEITESAVQSHLQAARKRLGLKNTYALIAWAVSRGFASNGN